MTSQPEAQKLMCPLGCGGMTENTSTQAMPLLTVCASEPAPVRTDGRALRAAGARVHAQRCLQAVLLPMPQSIDGRNGTVDLPRVLADGREMVFHQVD